MLPGQLGIDMQKIEAQLLPGTIYKKVNKTCIKSINMKAGSVKLLEKDRC
jgi:hypothetical protein